MDQVEKNTAERSDLPRGGAPWLRCSCCGTWISDTPEENACFGIQPYPHDDGFGECLDCFGNPAAADLGERLGWVGQTFFDTRIQIVRERLSPENQKLFDELPYERKLNFIVQAIERGLLI